MKELFESLTLEDLDSLPPIRTLDREALEQLIRALDRLYEELEAAEPEDEDSEEYDQWLDDLEEIDDLRDEIQERLEEG